MRASLLMMALAAVFAAGCSRDRTPADTTATATPAAAPVADGKADAATQMRDEHSYAEPDLVRISDIALDLAIDFAKKQLAGSATYALDWKDQTAAQLVLDTRDLDIQRIEGVLRQAQDERGVEQWTTLPYALAARDAILGSKLTIETPQRPTRLRITYRTSPEASGLQWLEPGMTAGGRTPFMFSQSQQVHARSWVPLQDTPSVRFTYTAHVTAPKDAMVLMSADNDPKAARDGDYSFKMPQPIPSYLLAIAAGDMVFAPISARSGVWAEPSMAKKAAAEFADTEKMMQVAEKLYGPYRWGRYDILVLPPSFPYGGMENPRLTFATPTVIVGDKSLVSLIAHELAHSWSGNLVTFATVKDAWLNEGFTSYVENRIIEALYGLERADMENVIERNALAKEFTPENTALQALAVKAGVIKDPDDNLTGTVYTKGAWMLQLLEQRIGRESFDAFLKSYFDHFAFQSITTAQFVDYAKTNLLAKYPGKVTEAELEAWLYQPGVPDTAPKTTSARFDAVDAARKTWLDGGTLPAKAQTSKWSTQEWVFFIEGMPQTLTLEQLKALDATYKLTGTPNGEIAQRWYPLAERSIYVDARPAMAAFLQRIGRRKLIMPTYTALATTPDGLAFAREVFAKARPGYHPITTGSVETLLAKANPAPVATPAAAPTPTTPAAPAGVKETAEPASTTPPAG